MLKHPNDLTTYISYNIYIYTHNGDIRMEKNSSHLITFQNCSTMDIIRAPTH